MFIASAESLLNLKNYTLRLWSSCLLIMSSLNEPQTGHPQIKSVWTMPPQWMFNKTNTTSQIRQWSKQCAQMVLLWSSCLLTASWISGILERSKTLEPKSQINRFNRWTESWRDTSHPEQTSTFHSVCFVHHSEEMTCCDLMSRQKY